MLYLVAYPELKVGLSEVTVDRQARKDLVQLVLELTAWGVPHSALLEQGVPIDFLQRTFENRHQQLSSRSNVNSSTSGDHLPNDRDSNGIPERHLTPLSDTPGLSAIETDDLRATLTMSLVNRRAEGELVLNGIVGSSIRSFTFSTLIFFS